MAPRKLPTPKDKIFLSKVKEVRYQVGTKAEQHKKPLERGMPSRSSVRWYLGQCSDVNQAAWMSVIDKEMILSVNKEYCQELLQLSEMMLTEHGKLSTVWNKTIAAECDYLHAYILNKYEIPRLKRVEEVSAWVCMLDPDEKLYKYKWKEKSKKVGHSRSISRRLIKRISEKLLDKYGLAQDNVNFRAEHWGQILNFEEYIYKNAHKGYDASEAFKLFE
ncbi:hypothetical protein S14_59 [Shewanella sp. phage 1/4]|uniref:hypothetical protein n=1 Tax=Shewanella phage 1/4 TaxID=1458859 RepID=UPI0004F6FEB0|nr:hypothetical protein S14_59 [Shewanella sp. phage 1/4]AHK11171.1 hypothetical protein S14_59 [Shewanella sp. phage 1/4]